MIYYLLRPLVRISFFAFYRKIHCTGRAAVLKKGPILFTANHPTAFIEPCFLACFSGRTLHFMTRGDIFSTQFVRWLLAQVHLIPIYRFVDGYKGLRQNERSIGQAKTILSKAGAVLIMAEGRMAHEKRLRPIQKGAARIGLEAMISHSLPEVHIQPVAINYTYAHLARTEIMVDFAPPFPLSPYVEMFRVNPKAALEIVTSHINRELAHRVIHISKNVDEATAEKILQMARNTDPTGFWPVFTRDKKPLLKELKAIHVVNQLDQTGLHDLQRQINRYFELLDLYRLDDLAVARAAQNRPASIWKFGLLQILMILCLIPHAVPLFVARWVTKRTVKIIEFRSSVLMGSALFAWLIYAIVIVLIAWLNYSFPMGFLTFIFLISTGAILILLESRVSQLVQSYRFGQLRESEQNSLLTSRMNVVAFFKRLQIV